MIITVKQTKLVFMVLIAILFSGCNADSRATAPTTLNSSTSIPVSSTANMGVIINATITAYQFTAGAKGPQVGLPAVTDAYGQFNPANLGTFAGPVLLELSDPSSTAIYLNEATGQMEPFPTGGVLRSVAEVLDTSLIAITPLTEIVTQLAIHKVSLGATDLSAIRTSKNEISSTYLSGIDPIHTIPSDVRHPSAAQNSNAGVYATVLAGLALEAANSNSDPITHATTYAAHIINNNGDAVMRDLARLRVAINTFTDNTPAGLYAPTVNQKSPPFALGQNVTTIEDTLVNITLDGGDNTNLPVMFQITAAPKHGRLEGTPPNLRYTPDLNYSGSDSFSFSVNNGYQSSNARPALVIINILPQADAPLASGGGKFTYEDKPFTGKFVSTSIDGDQLTYAITGLPSFGTASITDVYAGTFIYTPNPNFNGNDFITFEVTNSAGLTATGTYSVVVWPVNDRPIANTVSVSLTEDTYANITLSGSDIDGDTLTYEFVRVPSHGNITGIAPNLVYTPEVNYNGADSFIFRINDGTMWSTSVTANINVSAVNDAPVFQDMSVTVPPSGTVTIAPKATDPDKDKVIFHIASSPANGTVQTASNVSTRFNYTAAKGFSGSDSFTLTASDGKGGSTLATVNVTVLPYDLSTNDTDGDGLRDADEIVYGTNPTLVDTDGDGFSDFDEIVTHAFNANVNNLRFNPLIADTPKIKIDITSPPDFSFNYTLDSGTTTSLSTNNTITQGTSVSTSNSSEQSQSFDFTNGFGAEIMIGFEAGPEPTVTGSVTASYNHEETVSSGTTVAFSSENTQENSRTLEKAKELASSSNVSYSDGDIDVTVQITNTGHLAYTLKDLILSSFVVSKSQSGLAYGAVGQMYYNTVGLSPFPATTLAPGQTTTQLNFAAGGNDIALMENLMANSTGFTVKPATYNLLDQSGQPFNFSSTNIGTQTATVIVDFANNGGRSNIEESVAVHGNPNTSLSILDALQSILTLDVIVKDVYGNTSDVYANITSGSVYAVDGLADNGAQAHWLIIHGKQQGNNQMVTTVYTTPDEVARWQARSQGTVNNLVSEFTPSTIALNAGDILHLVYIQDSDLDGLSDLQEFSYNTNPQAPDTDFDGIQDSVEVMGWDIAYLDEFGSNIQTRVYSDPTLADTDADGITGWDYN